ncbi:uncharacterized protein LOC129768435 isoform X2 [Toxorhynchites rutilus septentrionalis]|uniref:uncharacterized protein LOC129768435 isoform X2 n=1 Tax=Toxorhynchites rutilus septentrionalis TaxID=329112 RepID=UPI002478E899|nr:uncharacterized protein LOC129768435 isoform X2 [Toxorhynchites rutilus septentrionalis]
MWLFGFSLLVIVCTAKCTEADVSVEAAFQEINSTSSDADASNAEEEDVLYQRGASFSAKLDMSDLHISMKSYDNNDSDDDGGGGRAVMTPINLNTIDGELTLRKAAHNWKMESAKLPTNTNKHGQLPQHSVPAQPYVNKNNDTPKRAEDTPGDSFSRSPKPIRMEIRVANSLHMQHEDGSNRSEIKALALTAPEDDPQLDGRAATTTATVKPPAATSENVTGSPSAGSNYNTTAVVSDSTVAREPCTLDCGYEGICSNGEGGQPQHCLCPFGKSGSRCEEDFRVNTPRFNQRSWLAFPTLRAAYKHVQLHIEFRPESFDGILLLTGERDDLTGDFMALLIHQGFVEFWFDCGSGTGRVRSEETIVLNQWNTITIYRHRWDAWLVLNQGNRVQGRSKGLFSRITFREPVFLGGFGNITGLDKKLPVSSGFTGCIRKFVANEHDYNFHSAPLGDVSQGFDIQECVTDRCSRFPCQHGGKCLPSDDGAICLCPLGFGGDLCEMRLDLQVPSFNGSSYLRYAPLGDSCIIWFELKIIIKPLLEDGLLLYSGHHEYGDYISLCLNMGYVEFTFDLGSGPATVRSEFPLSMGQWHTIKVSRTSRLAVLKIDQLPEVMTVSPNGFWHLSLPHSLYLGGVHNVHTLPMSLRDKGSFAGCVQKVDINDRTLSIISEALGGSNVENCPHACVARPCGPLAKCVPNLDSYECQCNPRNKMCNKAEELPSELIEQRQRMLLRQRQERPQQQKRQQQQQLEEDEGEEEMETTRPPITTTTITSTADSTFANKGASSSGEAEYYYYEYDSEEDNDWTKEGTNENKSRTKESKKVVTGMGRKKSEPKVTTQSSDDYTDYDSDSYGGNGPILEESPTSSNGGKYEGNYYEDDYSADGGDNVAAESGIGNGEKNEKSGLDENYTRKTGKHSTFGKKPLSTTKKQSGDGMREIYTSNIGDYNDGVVEFGSRRDTNSNGYSVDGYHRDDDDDHSSGDRIPYRPDLTRKTQNEQQSSGKRNRKQPERDTDIDKVLIEEMNRIMKNRDDDSEGEDGELAAKEWSFGMGEEELRHAGVPMGGATSSDRIVVSGDEDDDDIDISRNVVDVDGRKSSRRRDENTNLDEGAIKTLSNGNGRSSSSSSSGSGSGSSGDSKSNPNTGQDRKKSIKEEDDVSRGTKYKNKYFRRYQGACFTGTESFFHYSDAETMRRIISYEIDLNLRFKTHSNNGLILWTGRHSALEGDDFLSLGIENGYLHLRYNLGSGEINIKYNSTKVSDGLWHRVRALRNSQDGTLKVDGGKPITRRSPGKLRQLNTDTGLYVGGLPAAPFYTRQRYTAGIVGCISELILAGELRLNFDPTILGTAHNVEPGAP